jgi:hypothetical protein
VIVEHQRMYVIDWARRHASYPFSPLPAHLRRKKQRHPARYVTRSEAKLMPESMHTHKLTSFDVLAIRVGLAEGEAQVSLAARFGVDPVTITDIKLGRTWTHLK